MQILTYGQKVPDTGDKGNVWFPALAANFTAIDAHNHNGTNSPILTAGAITSVTASVSAASWAAVSSKLGLFKQTVSLPSGYLYASKMISFRTTGGNSLFLQTEAGTATDAFVVYCNNSALDVVAFYGI